ncbi:exo-alpha-sialidase [Cohnella fermenti]|uniref:Sialidase domain-containing protein n=1 Tax=Cohnella fermenti TaxID=2565925 RepID=A0A4V3WDU2_9BACL|nr:exo-alpha-sialidase [Cohnella fermenti]THF73596.1 hypothetical protein E6C55_28345 [Cohnella fermenti]
MEASVSERETDKRWLPLGSEIPKEFYCDQPYVVVTKDGSWLCVLTTGKGVEGEPGQHAVSTISRDQGKSWTPLTDIEPADGPESSWVMPLVVPSGRIYAFYTYNGDNQRTVLDDGGQQIRRVDTLGQMAFKYSDDHGRSWSDRRYVVPIRGMEIDRRNPYRGSVQFFWGVGKPCIHENDVYIGLAKVGGFGVGFMTSSEGVFLKSNNLLHESDPERIKWETLPDGDRGIRAPLGPIADEHNCVGMGDGSLYCTFRTIEGHNGAAYSRDGGHTWTEQDYARYTPGGRAIKHPRAANFVRRFSNGHYLMWFHNHGRSWLDNPVEAYKNRNPAWICGGVERDGHIVWSQPEIVLYDDDLDTRISYPDFIEDDGRYFITETQKTIARVHQVDNGLLEAVWSQHERCEVAERGAKLSVRTTEGDVSGHDWPQRLPLGRGEGFALDLWLDVPDASAEPELLTTPIADTRDPGGSGVVLTWEADRTVRLRMNDGRCETSWSSDPGALDAPGMHHLVVNVDAGPRVIVFIVDGQLLDGGTARQFGWGRLPASMSELRSSAQLRLGTPWQLRIAQLRLYDRYLTTTEAIGNYRAEVSVFAAAAGEAIR